MPWVRLDEHALNHVKILALSHAAFRLWIEGLAHCQKHLTNGLISRSALRGFRYGARPRIDELTASVDGAEPLWEAHVDGFMVHDYLKWNDDKEHVLAKRKMAKDRMAKLRGCSAPRSREHIGEATQNESCTTTTVVPKEQELPRVREARRSHPLDESRIVSVESLTAFDGLWTLYPRKDARQRAQAEWRDLNPDAPLALAIAAAVRTRLDAGWAVDTEARFLPSLATFLGERRWQERYTPQKPKAQRPEDPMRSVPGADETKAYLASLKAQAS